MKLLKVVIVVSLLLIDAACGVGQDVNSDSEFEPGGRFAAPDINIYFALFNAGYNPLNLGADVQLKGREVLKAEVDRMGYLDSEEKRHELMRSLTQEFDSEQLAAFRQHVRLQFYKSDWLRHLANAEPDISVESSFYWLHPELEQVLQVTAQQKQVVLNRIEKFASLSADQDNRLQNYLKDLFNQWQERLEDVLLPRQLQQFESAIGKPFEFDSALSNVFAFAYSQSLGAVNIPLCLTKTASSGEIDGGVLPQHLLLIGEQTINGRMDFHAETELLLTNSVQVKLELTKAQIDGIRKLQDRYVKVHPLPRSIHFSFRRRGMSIEQESKTASLRKSGNSKEAPIKEANDEQTPLEFNRLLLELLKVEQQLRWRQIQNQVVLAFGWREVSLSFPDWPSFLELSDEQTEQFESIHVEMETRYSHALESMWNEQQLERKRIEELSGEILTIRQKAQLVLLFGKFATF
jgi:hypothetical protein